MQARVRALEPDDWAIARDVRLAALADAPGAFGSTLAAQQANTEADWRAMLDGSRGIRAVAEVNGAVAGVIGAFARESVGEIIWMWVAPGHRGSGVGDVLVAYAVDWCGAQGLGCVLWVVDGNERARRFYARVGFTPTGKRQPFPSDPERTEFQMAYRPVA